MARGAIRPVILAGGEGSRLWPLSRRDCPKQFLPLVGDEPLIVETARRVSGDGFLAPMIVGNVEHRFLIAECFHGAGIAPAAIILEPQARNTAGAVAVAALSAAPDDVLLAMPADHRIAMPERLVEAVELARACAEDGRIVTFGVTPSDPNTGYGYIEVGDVLGREGVHAIAGFHEKPDAARAEELVHSGRHLWNAGLFMFKASSVLNEFAEHAPDVLAGAREAVAGAVEDLDFVRLDADAFGAVPSVPFDIAVMEKSAVGAVVPVDMGWSDVGSWRSLWEVSQKDQAGNLIRGDVRVMDAGDCTAWSGAGTSMVLLGLKDVVCVANGSTVLVCDASRAGEVKDVVAGLDPVADAHLLASPLVRRPWGSYETLATGSGYLVKRLTVKPGGCLSLQFHHRRAEHWVVVAGTARVTRGEETFDLESNASTFIPQGAPHRLENRKEEPLVLIEVQTGDYLGEDDIVRLDDVYGRVDEVPR